MTSSITNSFLSMTSSSSTAITNSHLEQEIERLSKNKVAMEKVLQAEISKIKQENEQFRQRIESYYQSKNIPLSSLTKALLNKLSPNVTADTELLKKLDYLEKELLKMEKLNNDLAAENMALKGEYNEELFALISMNEQLGSKLDTAMGVLEKKNEVNEVKKNEENTSKENNDLNSVKVCQQINEENVKLSEEYKRLIANASVASVAKDDE